MGETEKILLDGSDWKFQNEENSITGSALVPGSIYTDLVRAKFIGNPYYRFNDVEYRWVSRQNWTYSRNFNVSSQLLQKKVIELECHGVDTIASIYINKKLVGTTKSMFLKYIFDVKDKLQEGPNIIEVQFSSPTAFALNQASQYSYEVPPKCPPPCQNGDCQFNFIRKMACSFSWDWGPSFPTMGIWKSLMIVGYNSVQIDYVTVATEPTDKEFKVWQVKGAVYLRSDGESLSGKLGIDIPGLLPQPHFDIVQVTGKQFVHQFSFNFSQADGVKLWWPNGEGNQVLYTLRVTFSAASNQQDTVAKSVRFGFRKVELLQESIPNSKGLTFYFRVNGIPIFMKGSNWIPADSFNERITPDYLHILLKSTAVANMNMLRVWGGGIYETDQFYDLADELGILIWQDFMYACALYPTNDEFLDLVRLEVTHQIRHLHHHACIALWAGNNENEAALRQNWWQITDYQRYYDDYVKLYITTIRDVVLKEDTSRPFVSSSPSNGVESEKENWVAKNPQDEYFGDVHHYDYAADSWTWLVYPVPRFASEYGLQAWSSFESLSKISLPEDWDMDGKFAASRQHHTDGNKEMLDELSAHMKPPAAKDAAKKFRDFTYLTQINQAVGIKTETELYRRSQSDTIADGRGLTMGALYWQLNDIWHAPTWASIEFGGKWKMLHYYARNFFKPTLLSPYLDGSKVKLYYISDVPASEQTDRTSSLVDWKPNSNGNLDLWVTVYSWQRFQNVSTFHITVEKPRKSAGLVWESDVTELLKGTPREQCFIGFSLGSEKQVPDSWLLLNYFTTAVGLKKANIKVKEVGVKEAGVLWIKLSTDNIAPFVWLEAIGIEGYFSDNGFIMTSPEITILFHIWSPGTNNLDIALFARNLSVQSLMDVYSD